MRSFISEYQLGEERGAQNRGEAYELSSSEEGGLTTEGDFIEDLRQYTFCMVRTTLDKQISRIFQGQITVFKD